MTRHTLIHKEHRLASQGAIFLCAVLWSTSGLFIKLVDWHPMAIAGGRSALAALFLLALRFFAPGRRKRMNSARMTAKDFLVLSACGLCYAATMILFVIANKLTASANAILLQYTAPVWAALLGWLFLRERPRWEHWCAMALVCLGMLLVFSGGLASGSMLGDVVALISGLTFGANSVVMRTRKDGNPADIFIFSHIECALFSVPFFFLHPPAMTSNNVLSVVFMGIIQIGMASALFAYGIKRVSAVQAMLIATIEPVLNPVWVLLVVGEKPTVSVLAGGALIVGAVLFTSMLSALRRRS